MDRNPNISWKRRRARGFSNSLEYVLGNLETTGRGYKQAISIGADFFLAGSSLWIAYSLRYGDLFSDFRNTWYLFLLTPAVTVLAFAGLGVYRWVVRSSNHRLFKQLLKGSFVSALALLVIFFLIPPARVNPRSLIVIYGLLLFLSTVGVRSVWRGLFNYDSKGEPIAVYGAGAGGRQLVSMLFSGSQYRPVAFIDDEPTMIDSTVVGLPVFSGNDPELKTLLQRREASKIVMAIPSLSSMGYHRKLQNISGLNLPVLTMPSVVELVTGTAKIDDVRDVSITDILGRGEVIPDVQLMSRRVTGRTVLVTGGGGSIGSELCRQVMKLSPKQLIILDNSEANLYHITEELNQQITGPSVTEFVPLIGSVLDKNRLEQLFKTHSVDTVFHAAAYKHVPIVEAQPDQGVEVNVFGTQTVLDCAIQHGASDFVLISTDKAVRPTNSMGASKRVAELVLQARASECDTTRISMVRFGNVLGSSGSVVPKFKRQILEGGPISLTHRDVTRYFMTIPEASQLVLQASAISKGGDVFVLDMGEPIRIEELAITMVRLFGKKLKRDTGDENDIDIVIEGLRPGEKLYEELFISDSFHQTEVQKISSTSELWLEWKDLAPRLEQLKRFVKVQDVTAIRTVLMELAFISDEYAGKAAADGVITLDGAIESIEESVALPG